MLVPLELSWVYKRLAVGHSRLQRQLLEGPVGLAVLCELVLGPRLHEGCPSWRLYALPLRENVSVVLGGRAIVQGERGLAILDAVDVRDLRSQLRVFFALAERYLLVVGIRQVAVGRVSAEKAVFHRGVLHGVVVERALLCEVRLEWLECRLRVAFPVVALDAAGILAVHDVGELEELVKVVALLGLVDEVLRENSLWLASKERVVRRVEVQMMQLLQGQVQEVAVCLDQLVPLVGLGVEHNAGGLVAEARHLEGLDESGDLVSSLALPTTR